MNQKCILVDVDKIRVNHKKLRKLSNAKIVQYIRDYEGGDTFPPITVDDCDGFYTIGDGRHRYQAQRAVGFALIEVIVR
jgi:ParB-like chromosome segregation protein Spo0J